MSQQRRVVGSLVVLGCLMVLPSMASAQGSGFAGVVKDSTGGVMPGVTVEASSPALIEKVRTVVTDEQGLYKIVDLRPGTYAVTFTLAGFSTVRREGVELPTNFTATINADLRVGSLEETVTVSGASPVVDVQNTAVRQLLPRVVLDTIPVTGSQALVNMTTPGAIVDPAIGMDVGGSKGDMSAKPAIHGGHSSDQRQMVEGLDLSGSYSTGVRGFQPVTEGTQEISIDLGGGSAESSTGGIAVNYIPKDGGNTFNGNFLTNFANGAMQGSNLSDALVARGLNKDNVNHLKNLWDLSGSLGGPIKRDRVWFFTAHRKWASTNFLTRSFENSTPQPQSFLYTPDTSRPGLLSYKAFTHNFRVSSQLTPRTRFRVSYDYQERCDCNRSLNLTVTAAPEANTSHEYTVHVGMANLSFPATNRLLFEVGWMTQVYDAVFDNQDSTSPVRVFPHPPENKISILDTYSNILYGAYTEYSHMMPIPSETRFAVSYVTGSHAFKTGTNWRYIVGATDKITNHSTNYTFRNQVPTSITLFADPFLYRQHQNADLGLFVQDQWTIKNLTLNIGLRLDYMNESVDPQQLPAGRYIAARQFDGVSCAPCWTDLSPRLSASYNLFGDGKTALKVSLSRYVAAESMTVTTAMNPITASVQTATRAWDDKKAVPGGIPNDFIPQEAELGPLSNPNFGGSRIGTRFADDTRSGFQNRITNWQGSASIQQEVWPGASVSFGYFRTTWGNARVTDNLSISPADFDPYCVTVPADPRLPNGGRYPVCGLYNITEAAFARPADNLVSKSSKFGKEIEAYDGFDLTINARLRGGGLIGGGMNTGRTITDNCAVLQDSPQKPYCRVTPPFWQPQIKLYGSYRLPKDFQASLNFQSIGGIPISASYSATLAEIRPSLGRPLAGKVTSVIIDNLFEPQTQFEGRINMLDLRLTRTFSMGRTRVLPKFDLYNLLNASPVLQINNRLGPSWLQPVQILDARLAKFELQVQF